MLGEYYPNLVGEYGSSQRRASSYQEGCPFGNMNPSSRNHFCEHPTIPCLVTLDGISTGLAQGEFSAARWSDGGSGGFGYGGNPRSDRRGVTGVQ